VGSCVDSNKICFVTGDLTPKEQALCAKKWALVGNENHRYRSVIVVGVLFNLSCLLQAIRRLRPKQRDSYANVCIIIPDPVTKEVANTRYKTYQEDDRKCSQMFVEGQGTNLFKHLW